ncbi:hypothetical protein [Kitasatospora cinereorecta]
MSEAVGGRISKATFERAASGSTVPSWDTVERFIVVTRVKKDLFGAVNAIFHSRELWVRARRATRAPYYVHQAPDPALVSCTAGFLRAAPPACVGRLPDARRDGADGQTRRTPQDHHAPHHRRGRAARGS